MMEKTTKLLVCAGTCRDIDADCRRNFRIFRSVALHCADLGRSFGRTFMKVASPK